jgi:tetratricopeptide (TPR) repeat protein
MSLQKAPAVRIPRLVRDALYAPQCPNEHVSMLVDVALAHHNAGRFDDAVAAYDTARTKWEDALLAQAIEDAGLSRLAAEAAAKPWLLTGEPDPTQVLLEAEREKQTRERRRERRIEKHLQKAAARGQASDSVVVDDFDPDLPRDDDTDEEEAETNRFTLDPAAGYDRERHIEQLRAIYATRDSILPPEKLVFLHLAVGAVFSSAQQDADALAEYGEAKHILVTAVPVFHASLLATNVYAALGVAHYHLSQYDFAGDYFFRCLEAREQLCGVNHVDTAAALNNVAATLYMLGKSSDALLLFNRAYDIACAQLPVSHPRRDTIDLNTRIAKGTFFTDATFPSIPFTPHTVPMIPGAMRARQFRAPKPKKAAPVADAKKKK